MQHTSAFSTYRSYFRKSTSIRRSFTATPTATLSASSIQPPPLPPVLHEPPNGDDAISISLAPDSSTFKKLTSTLSPELSSILTSLDTLSHKPGRLTPLTPTSVAFSTSPPKTNDSNLTPLPSFPLLARLNSNNTYTLKDELGPNQLLAYLLSGYKFTTYKSSPGGSDDDDKAGGNDKDKSHPTLHLPSTPPSTISSSQSIASAIYLTRTLINTPAEDCTPLALQRTLEDLASTSSKSTCETWVGDELLKPNPTFDAVKEGGVCGQIYAVGRAATSSNAPRLISFSHNAGTDFPSVTLVGKGVTFDTGGLSMKSPGGMLNMKKDMGGAAHVIGLAKAIVDMDIKINLKVLVPAVENSVDANSIRPLDIITAINGKTTEIGNTDAEGRLILADALALAASGNPDLVIDFATLTGAARVALGTAVPAYFCNNDKFSDLLTEASRKVNDPIWRMPLYEGYADRLKSKIADLRNVPSDGGMGGAITAALYLKNFVKNVPWVHFDVNGADGGGWGEAQGFRSVLEMISKMEK